MSKKCKIILIILLIVLILIGFAVYCLREYIPRAVTWLKGLFQEKEEKEEEKEEPESLGEEIFDNIKDPMENMPETNPFKTKLNPFE